MNGYDKPEPEVWDGISDCGTRVKITDPGVQQTMLMIERMREARIAAGGRAVLFPGAHSKEAKCPSD